MSDIKVPTFPESISEGTIAAWHKKEGDTVAQDEIIVEVETDKVVMEVPATEAGVIGKIIKGEGETVISEEIIGSLGDASASENQSGSNSNNDSNTENTQPEATASDSGSSTDVLTPSFPESISEGTVATWHKQVGDSVEQDEVIVEIETDKVMMEVPATTSGVLTKQVKAEGDTVTSQEVIGAIGSSAGSSSQPEPTASASTPSSNAETISQDNTKQHDLSPSARRAAKEANVDDTSNIQGSGKDGRVTKQDIKQAASSPAPSPKAAPTAQEFTGERPEKRVRMTRLRQTVARRLLEVQQSNAILTTFNEVDMKPVMDLRKKYKDQFLNEHGAKLGFMSFFLKAATDALKKFPDVNASIDGDEIVYHGYFDIGVAVGSDRGLVVPVIRDTDYLSFADIEATIVEKAVKARDGKLSLEEMQGGTFTITNGGTYGSMMSTPIINAPQSAILGMHNIVERPVAINGEVVIRPMMYIALSYDHRIIDGSVSVRFLKMIKEIIEDPARMLLGL
jgi:2-oxoglutarate dehydrogenase E2 component (dihydrolipoamide succinyltransferase)